MALTKQPWRRMSFCLCRLAECGQNWQKVAEEITRKWHIKRDNDRKGQDKSNHLSLLHEGFPFQIRSN